MKKRRLKRYVKSHKSLFLTLAASTGVVLTGIFAGTGTIKANKIIKSEEKKAEIGNVELTKTDIFLLTWKCYIPAVASGVGSIACIFGLNVLNKKQQEQLISAYALLNNTYHEYRKQVIERYGEEVDEEIRENLGYAAIGECSNICRIDCDYPDEKAIFYDPISGNSVVKYEQEVMAAEYHLNRNFIIAGGVTLNMLYDFLGLPQTKEGEELGWSLCDGYCWIDFEHTLLSKDDGGMPVYSIDAVFSPHDEYDDY